ncbi:MAG: isoprenylcysteine carboxylmethyltransferase family protein [Bacteroidales bacterium]|nr:isoprenylcysteine carboxylmethyltransferase family protein [Bacteroidales bacterium]
MKDINKQNIKTHHGHKDLVGEYKWGDLGQMILMVIFTTVWILDSFIFKTSTFYASLIPLTIRLVIGLLLLIIAGWLARSGLKIIFGETREKPEVVKKGVFKIVRHPIYLGAILLYLGLIVITISLLSLAIWLIIIVFYYIISKYEEKILTQHLGEDYIQYKREVPMLLPFLKLKI